MQQLFSNKRLFTLRSTPIFLLIIFSLTVNTASAEKIRRPATQNPYQINRLTYYPIPSSHGYIETGIASWYGDDFHGRPTSNGETYNMYEPTAAHKLLPMNTMLLVSNLENGKETVVRVNDRGPFIQGRIIDLSYAAAKSIGILRPGTAKVKIVALAPRNDRRSGIGIQGTQYDFETGEYYVQIGSFTKKHNALDLQKRFTEAGHTTVIQKFFHPKSTYFRVQVYVGTNLHGARRAEKTLHQHGYKGAFIIAR